MRILRIEIYKLFYKNKKDFIALSPRSYIIECIRVAAAAVSRAYTYA